MLRAARRMSQAAASLKLNFEVPALTVENMLEARVHMGHKASTWNPKMRPFIAGVSGGQHVIDLSVSLPFMQRACTLIREVAAQDGVVLFLARHPGFDRPFREIMTQAGGYFHYDKWVGGTLTNAQQTMGSHVNPDLLVLLTPQRSHVAMREARHCLVPTIGVIDTNSDPDWVDYVVPGNDDSLAALTFYTQAFAGALAEGALAARVDKKAAASAPPRHGAPLHSA